MHFLNLPTILEGIFSMMQSFAKDKMRERLIVRTISALLRFSYVS